MELKEAYDQKYKGLKVEITDKRLKTISEVCRKVCGKNFAEACVEYIKENGYINPAQRYFGLHYRADLMRQGNNKFLKIMEDFSLKLYLLMKIDSTFELIYS